jgi:hypothetical protein
MTPLEEFYHQQPEPHRGCYLAMRDLVLNLHPDITADWKWNTPFFAFRKKMFCYFWKDKKTDELYIGFHKSTHIDHPKLEIGNRKLLKIYRINPNEDLPITEIEEILDLILKEHLS